MVLLPAIGRDAIVSVLGALLGAEADPLRWTLAVMVGATLTLSFVMIWLLLEEIARFYFHANHVTSVRGTTFTPRFTLTSLRAPHDEFGAGATRELELRRGDPTNIELLVPANDAARRSIDATVAAYDGLQGEQPATDISRAAALVQLAGVRDRDLLSEVVKVEYGMARHVIRVQVIVLRYIKALLAVIVTLVATFVMSAAVESSPTVDTSVERWVLAAVLVWCPAVLFVAAAPVRWLGRLLMVEGATASGIRYDRDLTRLERVASWFSTVVLMAALVCTVAMVTTAERAVQWLPLVVVAVLGTLAQILLLRRLRRA